jgi:Bifunctional DNA primase/polymerase, N-terminal
MTGMQATLDYLARGWSVLPLEPRSKLPATSTIRRTRGTSSWSSYRRRHATTDEVAAWAELDPEHNVGIALGETSDDLVALDGDAELPAGVRIPATATVRSARGRHFYARADAPVSTRRFPWGELRGEGSHIVAPQSTHPTGSQYEWEHGPDEGIATLEEFELPPLASRARAEDSCPSQPLSGLLGSKGLATWHSVENADAYAAVLGLPFERLGAAVLCVLHPEEHPSATLWPRRRSGQLAYHDFHAEREWVSLPTLLAWLSGHPHEPLTSSAYVVWAKYLDIEAGLVAPASVPLGELPADAPHGLCVVCDGFRRLFEARWLYEPGEPTPFSHRFAEIWCGCARATVAKHFPELRRLGLARYAGRDGRGTSLWLPGEGVGPLRR